MIYLMKLINSLELVGIFNIDNNITIFFTTLDTTGLLTACNNQILLLLSFYLVIRR